MTARRYIPEWIPDDLDEIRTEVAKASTISDSPLVDTLEELEQACVILLGQNLLDSENYAESYKALSQQLGVFNQILRGFPEQLRRMGLKALGELTKKIPLDSPSDFDVIAVNILLIPVLRVKFRSQSISVLSTTIQENLERVSEYPVMLGGTLSFANVLGDRILCECEMLHLLGQLAELEWPLSVTSHLIQSNTSGCDWRIDPQLFARETLEIIGIETHSVKSAVDLDSKSNKFTVTRPVGNGSNVKEIRQNALNKYIESKEYQTAKSLDTHYSELPAAKWNAEKDILTIADHLVVDLSEPKKFRTLIQVREILITTNSKGVREFDLVEVRKNILKKKLTLKTGGIVTFGKDASRLKPDFFRGAYEYFDILFQLGDRGSKGDYRVNVRLIGLP
jgi:hypothetical protein